MMSLYRRDFLDWTQSETEKLRTERLGELDLANLAEEIESLGKQQRATLINRLSVLLLHLLKRDFQPERHGRSWELTMAEQRVRIRQLLKVNPRLLPLRPEAFLDAYESARIRAARETKVDLDRIPEICPSSVNDLQLDS
ncbi:MAG: DUF29 domain-containing protein [Acidobacteriota bacterium]|nr:DUF29 domain-containing protein [Acidobacteriota bacterium]